MNDNKKLLVYWNNNFPSIKNIDILSKIVNISDKVSTKCIVLYNPLNSIITFDRFKQLLETTFMCVEVYHISYFKSLILENNIVDIFIDECDLLNYSNETFLNDKNIHILNFEKNVNEEKIDDIDKVKNDENLDLNNIKEIINTQTISINENNNYNLLLHSIKHFLHLKDDFNINITKEEMDNILESVLINCISCNEDDLDCHIIERFISLLNDIKSNKIIIHQLFKPDKLIKHDTRTINIDFSNRLDLSEEEKIFNDSKVLNILKNNLDNNDNYWVEFGIIYNTKNPTIKYSNYEDYIYVVDAYSDELKNYIEKSIDKLEVKILNNNNEVKIYKFITPNSSYNYVNRYHCVDEILKSIDVFINTNFDFDTLTPEIIKKYVDDYYFKNKLRYNEDKLNITKFNKKTIDYYLKDMLKGISNNLKNIPIHTLLDFLLTEKFPEYNKKLLKIVILYFIYDNWEILKESYINKLNKEFFDENYSASLEYKGINNEQYACLIQSTNDNNNTLLLTAHKYTKYKTIKDKYINDLKDIIQSYYFNLSSILKIEEIKDIHNFYNRVINKDESYELDNKISKLNIGFVYKKVVEEALLSAKSINMLSKNINNEKVPQYIQKDLIKIYTVVENIFIETVYELENMIIRYKDVLNEEEIKNFVSDLISIILGSLYIKIEQLEGLEC